MSLSSQFFCWLQLEDIVLGHITDPASVTSPIIVSELVRRCWVLVGAAVCMRRPMHAAVLSVLGTGNENSRMLGCLALLLLTLTMAGGLALPPMEAVAVLVPTEGCKHAYPQHPDNAEWE